MQSPESSCCGAEGETVAYLTGQTPDKKLPLVEEHIVSCDHCRQVMAHIAGILAAEAIAVEELQWEELYQHSYAAALKLVSQQASTASISPQADDGADKVDRRNLIACSWLRIAASIACVFIVAAVALVLHDRSLMENDIDRSIAALQQATVKFRPNVFRITGLNYAPLRTRGEEANNGSELDRAQRAASTAIDRNPTPVAYHMLGRVLIVDGDYDAAIEYLQRALEGAPDDTDILVDLGVAQAGKGHELMARETFTRALKIMPHHPAALFNRIMLNVRLGQIAAARADLQVLLAAEPLSQWTAEAQQMLGIE